MNRLGLRLAWLVGLAGLWACSDDRTAGRGAAGETTNGIVLEGVLLHADGTPAARARVRLGKPQDDSILARGLTDDSGAYSLVAPRPGRYMVRCEVDSLAASQWVSVGTADRQRVPTSTQAKLSSLRGRVSGDVGDPSSLRVRVPGMGLEVPVGSDSSWTVSGVPAGWHLVQALRTGGSIVGEATGSTYVPRVIAVSSRVSTLIDDFEGDQGQGTQTQLLDGSWWGRWNDTSALVDSSRTWGSTLGLNTDSSSWSGRSLRVPMLVGAPLVQKPSQDRSAGLVIKIGGREDLDSQSVWFDMARIDSVVFAAKGTGTVVFEVKARSRQDRRVTWFRRTIVLSGSWTRYALAPADFTNTDGLAWSASQVRELYWTTHDNRADLWLDAIELAGLRPSDLLQR